MTTINQQFDVCGRRVLSGDRPTGHLHLGHYFGTLENRVRLQREGHEVFLVIADYQVLSDRDHPGDLPALVADMVVDYVACGMDPERMTVFVHSAVPALNQLLLPFLSVVTTAELSRNPTVKEEIRLSGRRSTNALMFTYPVHQAADILFCKANLIPVGRDQFPHLELTRTIARRFNDRYCFVFPVPEPLLGSAPLLGGLDGRKMAKSTGNGILLRDKPDEVAAKVRAATTDSERRITFEPERRPGVANLLRIAALCGGRSPESIAAEIGGGGAVSLKRRVVDEVTALLDGFAERRKSFTRADALAVLADGAERANGVADQTLAEVHKAMGMAYQRTKLNM